MNSFGSLSIAYELSPFKVILPEINFATFRIKEEDNKDTIYPNIFNGLIYFIADYNDNEANIFDPYDIEEKTVFKTTLIQNQSINYTSSCRLWKPLNGKIIIICLLGERLDSSCTNLDLQNIIIYYNEYKIYIRPETSVKIELYNIVPFIYSDLQTINMNDNVQTYELKFKFEEYNNELLLIYGTQNNYALLDNCRINQKELICNISKEKLESILSYNNETFKLGTTSKYFHSDFSKLKLVYEMIINYKIIEKINIYINITRVLNDVAELGSTFAYETNIESINNLITKNFSMEFHPDNLSCYFKKTTYNNLLLLCNPIKEGIIYLKEIKREIILDDIHYKYNFIIQPCKKENNIYVDGSGTSIGLVFSEIMNFTTEDYLYFSIITPQPELLNNIKLNQKSSSYLDYEDSVGQKNCRVPLSHFGIKKSGFYNINYLNHYGYYSIKYESNPIKVIWSTKIEIGIEKQYNSNQIKIGQYGYFYLVTNFNDNDNIFNPSEVENINFLGYFSDNDKNKVYKASCNLSKKIKGNLGIFCNLKEILENLEQNLFLNEIKFIHYDDYNIKITSKGEGINFKQMESNISFLYSDKQEINIENNISFYKLYFETEFYDNSPLYLYKHDFKSLYLSNCGKYGKKITCYIPRDDLLNLLSYDGESFYLSEKHDLEGLYLFNSVLNISFNYKIKPKTIQLFLGKLLTPIVSKNEFITYEVKAGSKIDKSKFNTDYFSITIGNNTETNCFIKKNPDRENVLLLCNATIDGKNSFGKNNGKDISEGIIFYSFFFFGMENNEEFSINNTGTKISSVSPLEMNFKEKESYILIYETGHPELLNGIKLNQDSSQELKCENKKWYKGCIVDKSHFDKSGYYYTSHTNYLGSKTISYEASPIKVTMPNNDENNYGVIIGVSVAGGVIIICVIIFLIWHYKKKKNATNINFEKGIEGLVLKQPISSTSKE